jgi:predicted PurR-regulated permease PerM
VSWFCGLIMLVPLLGAPVAMFLPALVTLILVPSAALWVLIVLVVYQNVLLHFLGPRVQSQSIGLPTLLVIAATLVGGILLGVWGVIIGVPVAAILYALAFHFVRRSQLRARAAEPPFGPDAASAAPAGDACGPDERPD